MIGGIFSRNNAGGFPIGGVVLIVSLMLLSMLVIGCTSQQSPSSASPANNSSGTPVLANKTDVIGDNKTAYEKTNQTIVQVIADGTYASDVSYAQPRGMDNMKISVTVKDGVITAASVMGINCDMMSVRYQDAFNTALPDLVIGKKINELSIPRNVAGSSLTTAAFKQYVGGLVQGQ